MTNNEKAANDLLNQDLGIAVVEMATVGRFQFKKKNGKPSSEMIKVFTTSDGGYSQVHVHSRDERLRTSDRKKTSKQFHTCIMLDRPEYFLHDTAMNKFEDRDQIQSMIDFFNSPSKQRVFTVGNTEYRLRTMWDYTIATWNEENPYQAMPISKDEDGYIVVPKMPDYMKLS